MNLGTYTSLILCIPAPIWNVAAVVSIFDLQPWSNNCLATVKDRFSAVFLCRATVSVTRRFRILLCETANDATEVLVSVLTEVGWSERADKRGRSLEALVLIVYCWHLYKRLLVKKCNNVLVGDFKKSPTSLDPC